MTRSLDPETLQTWLEWAGARLLALPSGGIKPQGPKVIWPEYEQNKYEVLDFRGLAPLRPPPPASQEIPWVDLILTLPNVCEFQKTRRILHARALVHPINGRYLYNWTRIAELLQVDRKTARNLHISGLREVVRKAEQEKVCRISSFFSATASAA